MGAGFKTEKTGGETAVFINPHGSDDINSVSIIPLPYLGYHGGAKVRMRAGQILVKIAALNAYAPVVSTHVRGAVSAKKTVPLQSVEGITTGAVLEFGTKNYREVVAVNTEAREVTVAGDNLTLADGDPVVLSRGYGASIITEAVTSKTEVKVRSVAVFRAGDPVSVYVGSSPEETTIASINPTKSTITLAKAITAKEGDIVIGPVPTDYKIGIETLDIEAREMNPEVATRDHGRVWKRKLIGYFAGVENYFKLIEFDDRTR